MRLTSSQKWGHTVAIGVVLTWGVTFINTKVLLTSGMTPVEIFIVRFAMAYACIWPFSERRLWCHTWRDEAVMLLLGLTGGSLYFAAENEALRWTMANNVSFLVSTAPLLTMLLALLFFREMRVTPRLVAGSLLAFAGMAAIIYNGHFVLHVSPRGDLLAIAAALAWALYSLLIRRVARRYTAVFITRKVFAYGVLTALPLLAWHPWQFPPSAFMRLPVCANLLFLGVVASFLCFMLWSWAVKQVGALRTNNYIYLNPIATLAASAIVLHEPVTPVALAGLAMIIAGLYVAQR
ncbi:MAG: DMT family transporter [Bacteroidaceae bacterium]|nr:DMT family transporter [Bacteroidaceae bacterium]